MKRPVITVLIGALLSTLLAAPTSAQQATVAATSIEGQVADTSGAPVPGVEVLAYTEADGFVGSGPATTGADGTYSLDGLVPGEYRVLFHGRAVGFVPEWYEESSTRAGAEVLPVLAGATFTDIDAVIGRGGSVSGTVAGHGGEPQGGMTVWAYDEDDRWIGEAATRSAADGSYELRGLRDGAYRIRFVAPAGSGLASEWSGDQRRRSSAAPVEVTSGGNASGVDATLDLATPPGAAPLRYRDVLFDEVETTSDVPYAEATTREGARVLLLADVYRPAGDTATSRPAMLLVHGGSFRSGSKLSPELVDQARYLAARGYVAVSISYRLSSVDCEVRGCGLGAGIADAEADAQAAVRWLRSNAATYGVDPDRIAIGGSSAGAITALNVGYNGDDPSPGPLPDVSSEVQAAVSLSGAALPWGDAGPGDAPVLLFHNEVDPLVSNDWARSTVVTAHAADLIAYLVTFAGAGHVPYLENRIEILDTSARFLYWMLDLADADQGSATAPAAARTGA